MSILIKKVELAGRPVDLWIEGERIKRIAPDLDVIADTVIDGRRKAVIPGLINTHTHAAMTLFRGYGDDMPLMPWLEECIWPNEAKLTYEDVYWGARLACLEMIKSGTTTFFDMYTHMDATVQAVEDSGLRAVLSDTIFDHFKPELRERAKREIEKNLLLSSTYNERIGYALGPHAIYTVSGRMLRWLHDFATANDLLIHLHLSETELEVLTCVKANGCTPVRYLLNLGVLSPRLVLAHGLYVDEEEIRMLADFDVKVVHNPASNMKLTSGYSFKYKEMRQAGITVGLGTDGCGSSNNLDMVEVMKLASLLGKVWRQDPEALTCDEMLESATASGADILRLESGRITEGSLADLCLVDLHTPPFTPNFNFVSNLVYSANGSCIDTLICNGKILMENRRVEGEDEILEQAAQHAYDLIKR
ncbi:amidohydrolase [Parabacteroides sp. Marseille-P3160]|uniref:amidohydrolase n=1 Tax=Parabacteroides sp. Marseille-P3160 TaxID=1917887 RepID=UPI0009B992B6|nr:amidohydrolase [Parabacteroides sp. Marseille-P3160]